MSADHPYGLCRLVHQASGPEAQGCIACEVRQNRKALCSTCKEKK